MKKQFLILASLAVLSGLTACRTITFTAPEGTDISCGGEHLGTGTASVKVYIIDQKEITFTKEGYKIHKEDITMASPGNIQVKLRRFINVNSNPTGADVYVNGGKVGTTPAKEIAIDDSGKNEVSIVVKKKGYADQSAKITSESPGTLTFKLVQDGPGRHFPVWKPTEEGVDIAFERISSDKSLTEQGQKVTNCRRLTGTQQKDNEYILDFCLLPDGKNLVASILKEMNHDDIQEYKANLWQISTVDEDAERVALTDEDAFNLQPSSSADGSLIYFASTRDAKLAIYRINLKNKNIRRNDTGSNTLDFSPSINPKGEQLVYAAAAADRPASSFVWMKASAKDSPENLTGGFDPQWSPDGKKILYTKGSVKDNEARIWVCDANGDNKKQLTKEEGSFNDLDAKWSSDGNKIIFSSNRSEINDSRNYDIYIMNADGSDITQLTTNPSHDDKPVMASDGKTIFFRSNRGDLVWDIWTMELNDAK